MQLSEITQKLSGVRKNGNGFVARCPAHNDSNPSLSITEKEGKTLIKCFAGCETDSVVSAMGLEMSDLFSDTQNLIKPYIPQLQKQRISTPSPENKNGSQLLKTPKIAAVYEYSDENGEILYENVRYEPKDFRQRKPDGNGGYEYKLNGVRRVPYRLPELIEGVKSGADVFLCEGEKDADNLRALGLTATNSKNWKPEFNQYINDSHCIILANHDKAGIKLATATAKIIRETAKTVKFIDLFQDESLPEKEGKDVSDWIEIQRQNGLDNDSISEKLCVIADNAEIWQPTENEAENENPFQSVFKIQTANQWIADAMKRPIPKALFDSFWSEGELCILFADTGKGKTILAVQIGDSISKGKPITNFDLEAAKQKVLYLDFELSDKQFEARYSEKAKDHFINHYQFDENFTRGEIDPDKYEPKGFKDFQEYLNFSLEYELAVRQAKVLIVDNITYLKNATETAKDALPLMKELNRLKKKFDLSILALAHTPKRDLSRPLNVNDLQGSKMLSNFADSIFAIGESEKDKNLRYLKQIKARNTEEIYHSENIITCQVSKEVNFLKFEFLRYDSESEHLKTRTDDDRAEIIERAKILYQKGETMQSIANQYGVSKMTISRYINQ